MLIPVKQVKQNNWQKDLSDSVFDFQRVVCPVLQSERLLDGELIPLEVATLQDYQHLTKQFDLLSGIDVWHLKTPIGIQGVASRIQWGLAVLCDQCAPRRAQRKAGDRL